MNRKLGLTGAVLLSVAALALANAPLLAGVSVSGPVIDTQTRGDWRTAGYGSCFFLLPNPEQIAFENPTGGGPFSDHPEHYIDNCFGGTLFDRDPGKSKVDFRIFIDAADPKARAFAFGNGWPADAGAGYWSPCRNAFFAATWNDLAHANDPLSAELKLRVEGSVKLAYYFLDASNVCRDAAFELFVNGNSVSSGEIEDFAAGKYVVYELSGLSGTTAVRLAVSDAAGDPSCSNSSALRGINSHLSGVLVSGSDCVPQQCFVCGNGIKEPGEECDDGDNTSGDGCSANCRDEHGRCGDGHVDEGEECDDGNTYDSDACDAYCNVNTVCGNRIRENGEQCDDGNTRNGDGCDSRCRREAICGNGLVEHPEECDDNNTHDGDGCSRYCEDENGDGSCLNCNRNAAGKYTICHYPPGNPENRHTIEVGSFPALRAHCAHGDTCGPCRAEAPVCGNHVVENGEECDDGNTSNNDGCDSRCRREAICGNDVVEPPEQCDDGNTSNNDGCDSSCRREAICGNDVVEPPEQCDDGNTSNNDGCDSSCRREAICGNDVVEPPEQCDDGNTSDNDGCSRQCQNEPGGDDDDDDDDNTGSCLNCPRNANGKYTICHYPPGNPGNRQTIEVGSFPSLRAHCTAHNDTCGPCR